MALKVWRAAAPPGNYMPIGHDGPRTLSPSVVNTFPANLPVQPGDVLGLHSAAGDAGCVFTASGPVLNRAGNAADGESVSFGSFANLRLNITAVIDPVNTFTLGTITRNKKKGTATISVTVPNPGDLTATGKGVKASGAAVMSKAVGAGAASLTIRAKGKKKRKLNNAGKVKLNAAIAFTPTGGNPSVQPTKVKLKKNL
jgi:hypothetical protein